VTGTLPRCCENRLHESDGARPVEAPDSPRVSVECIAVGRVSLPRVWSKRCHDEVGAFSRAAPAFSRAVAAVSRETGAFSREPVISRAPELSRVTGALLRELVSIARATDRSC